DEAALARTRAFLERHLPGALGQEIYTKTCLYTMPPDRDFVLDRLPDHPRVHAVLGAAHGFKYASLFGRIVAERIADGTSPSDADLEGFRIDRPILLEPNPVTSFMV
ncbi:MAG: N-methyl-L-tryptophan oxidase, partial [Chloroflexota bacterium]|nr:N-methyl-L-tryptophan oxidase [Chloroflexota bacterium]